MGGLRARSPAPCGAMDQFVRRQRRVAERLLGADHVNPSKSPLNRSGAISVYLTGMIFGARVMSTQLIERLFHFRTKPRYKKITADPRRGDAMTDDPLPQPADLFHRDGRGRSINWEYLVQEASLEEVSDYLWSFDSYARAQAIDDDDDAPRVPSARRADFPRFGQHVRCPVALPLILPPPFGGRSPK